MNAIINNDVLVVAIKSYDNLGNSTSSLFSLSNN